MAQQLSVVNPEPAAAPPKPFAEMPGDRGRWPLVGDLFEIVVNPPKWVARKQREHGNIFWTNFLNFQQVAVLGPDANRLLLLDRDKVFSSKWGWDWFIGELFTRGLMLRDFDDHIAHRRVMQMAFRKEAMAHYTAEMSPVIEQGIGRWERQGLALEPGTAWIPFYPAIKQLTLDLAARVFMGTELGPEATALNKAFVACVDAGGAWIKQPIPGLKYNRGLRGRKFLEDYFYGALPEKRRRETGDMFSRLCHAVDEDGNRYSDRDVVDHMIFLLMAAHDTTTITLTTMVYQLAKHPEWQERLREQSRAVGKAWLDYEDLGAMTDMELVMKEAMRLIAPVPVIPRMTTREIELMGYRIPKNTLITMSIDFTHRMPEYWPEPDTFDPERFADHRREDKVHRYAFSPFGGGTHKCIGMHFADHEIKAILHQMLLTYRWRVPEGYEMKLDFASLPKPKDRLPLGLERLG